MSIDMFRTKTVSNNTIKKCFLSSAKNIVQCTVPEVVTARNAYLKRRNLSDDCDPLIGREERRETR